MITTISVDVTPEGAKRKKFKDVPFFFDPQRDVKYAYPINDGEYMRVSVDGEVFDVNTTDEILDSLVKRFGDPQRKIGFKPANLNIKKKLTTKKKGQKK